MLTFLVPPGIGDFSAMYCKLCNIDREMEIVSSSESPNRLCPFLDVLPKVKNGGYANHGAMTAVTETLPPGTDISALEDGPYFLSINHWLETGGMIADWIPGETTYHYEIDNKPEAEYAQHFLNFEIEPGAALIGVYCSAYGNSRHWGFWDYSAWRDFITRVHTVMPDNVHYLMIGAEYDLAISDILHGWMQAVGMRSTLALGEFHIGSTIELIRNMDYLFSFPSGLAFLADVVNTPSMTWLPSHMERMLGTFVDPVNYESNFSYHGLFATPENAFNSFRRLGLPYVEERVCKKNS